MSGPGRSIARMRREENHEMSTATATAVRTGAILNGFVCDPATAEHVITDSGGDDRMGMFHALEGTLYQAPEGHWFVVRALTPDEAREWLECQGDKVLLRHRLPREG